jgi:uncharacterized membrane protein YbhN (UPF0104 family)
MQLSKLRPARLFGLALSVSLLAAIFLWLKPDNLLANLGRFPIGLLFAAMALIVVNQITVIYRYRRILAHFGFDLPWAPVFKASVLGNLASLVVIPLMGQMIGRQAVLRAAGVTSVENAMIVAYERVLVAGVSAGAALLGGLYLLGPEFFNHIVNIPVVEIFLIIVLVILLNVWMGITRYEKRHFAALLSWENLGRILELLGVTIVSLGAMLSSFALLFHVVAPDQDWLTLCAMAAVVSFAASMPLSFGGWGLREVAAIYVLGLVGISAGAALSASIMCGLLSITVVLLLAAVVLPAGRAKLWSISRVLPHAAPACHARVKSHSVERTSAWLLASSVAVLVFFQIHVSLAGETVNLNLADPFAVLALSVIAVDFLIYRMTPAWNVPRFNVYLIAMWVALGLGLIVAWYRIGVTSWAFSKFMGWLVLLGYLGAGYIAVAYYRALGFRRIVQIMVSVLCVALIVFSITRSLQHLDLPGFLHDALGFQAYSGNRNALAFQILAVLALYLPLLGRDRKAYARHGWRSVDKRVSRVGIGAIGILLGGLLLTGSRSAYIAAALMLPVALALRAIDWRALAWGAVGGLAVWQFLDHLPWLYAAVSQIVKIVPQIVQQFFSEGGGAAGGASFNFPSLNIPPLQSVGGSFSEEGSDRGRWQLMVASIELWLRHPVLGGGLGYFLESSSGNLGFRSIIHNTVMWLLAELGAVGAVPFLLTFFAICASAFQQRTDTVRSSGILLLLLAFSTMSLFHEMLYQRIFWFAMGVLLASISLTTRAALAKSTA